MFIHGCTLTVLFIFCFLCQTVSRRGQRLLAPHLGPNGRLISAAGMSRWIDKGRNNPHPILHGARVLCRGDQHSTYTRGEPGTYLNRCWPQSWSRVQEVGCWIVGERQGSWGTQVSGSLLAEAEAFQYFKLVWPRVSCSNTAECTGLVSAEPSTESAGGRVGRGA